MSPDELFSKTLGSRVRLQTAGKHSAVKKPKPVPITVCIDVKVILRWGCIHKLAILMRRLAVHLLQLSWFHPWSYSSSTLTNSFNRPSFISPGNSLSFHSHNHFIIRCISCAFPDIPQLPHSRLNRFVPHTFHSPPSWLSIKFKFHKHLTKFNHAPKEEYVKSRR